MILYNEKEKRDIIMDYYRNPRNRVDYINDKNNYKEVYLHSSKCVDEIHLYYNFQKFDIKFKGVGCAIFLSSAEIFIETLLEKQNLISLDKLINLYEKLINKEPLINEEKEFLSKLNIFENVSNHLNRKECVLMISNVFKKIKKL